MDRLKGMEVFMRVVEDGSFVSAAEALDVSRPMASKHVQRLEEDLGVRLLYRTTRKVSLTEAGRSFYARCEEIFAQIDEAIAEAGNLQVEPRGHIRLNAPHSFGRLHLVRALAAFQTQYEGITVDLTLNDRVVDIVDEGYDLAVRVGHLPDSSLVAQKLAPCRTILCASPDYLRNHPSPQQPSDLKNHNCLEYTWFSESKAWRFRRDGETVEMKTTGDFVCNYGAAIVEAAVMGRGIILQPTFMTAPYLQTGELVWLLPEWKTTEPGIYAVYPQKRLLPQKVRVLIDFLVNAFGPIPPWDERLPVVD